MKLFLHVHTNDRKYKPILLRLRDASETTLPDKEGPHKFFLNRFDPPDPPELTRDDYDPNEKRDESGKWTSGGGGSSSSTETPSETTTSKTSRDLISNHQHRQDLANEITKKYGLDPIEFRENDIDSVFAIASAAGPYAVNVNTPYFKPERIAAYGKEWQGLSVGADRNDPQKTVEGIITHEIGHSALHQIEGRPPIGSNRTKGYKEWKARWQKIQDVLQKYFDKQTTTGDWPVSIYAQENQSEFAAESFAAMHLGRAADSGPPESQAKALANAKAMWDELFAFGIPGKQASHDGWEE